MARLAHVRVDPDNLGADLARPDVVALIERGYTLAALLPFEERGSPGLLLLMQPPTAAEVTQDRRPMWAVFGVGCVLVVLEVVQVVFAAMGG